ncbi:MAG: 3-dehydroquinate synthase [Flavobacteriales bacterium]|nr:MAG: 3-dehydroquinate synthase [Flavobacteriales bacterium]
MQHIKSTGYNIYFNNTGYQVLSQYLNKNKTHTIYILVDSNTDRCCFELLKNKLKNNFNIQKIIIPAGEQHKNIFTCKKVWQELTKLNADRKSVLINLGGGMVTDLGGFVAATFKRGIKFINIPTTLLSMVDASVGSKTGVDLDNLKNLIGLFANPEMVLIDLEYLSTLEKREFNSGLAEIIKYGLTFDAGLLNKVWNLNQYTTDVLQKIIYNSIQVKNKVVLEDFKETGLRKVLNFGHTIGHAIESFYLENESLPTLLHGEAIAIGMVAEAYISHKKYGFDKTVLKQLKNWTINTYGKIPLDKNHYPVFLSLMQHDKKNEQGTVKYVLLKAVGDFVINTNANEDLVIKALNFYNT